MKGSIHPQFYIHSPLTTKHYRVKTRYDCDSKLCHAMWHVLVRGLGKTWNAMRLFSLSKMDFQCSLSEKETKSQVWSKPEAKEVWGRRRNRTDRKENRTEVANSFFSRALTGTNDLKTRETSDEHNIGSLKELCNCGMRHTDEIRLRWLSDFNFDNSSLEKTRLESTTSKYQHGTNVKQQLPQGGGSYEPLSSQQPPPPLAFARPAQ